MCIRDSANAVRTDDHRVVARRNIEGDVEEQRVCAGRRVVEVGDDDAAHALSLPQPPKFARSTALFAVQRANLGENDEAPPVKGGATHGGD